MAPETKVCFQRWNVELDREAKLCRRDDQALHLLYAEARFYVDQGRIRPSPEQAMELDSLADPSFPAERQYLELARSLPGYLSYGASGVQVKEDIVANDIQIPAGTTVTCELDMERLAIKTGEVVNTLPTIVAYYTLFSISGDVIFISGDVISISGDVTSISGDVIR